MKNRWNDEEAKGMSDLEHIAYASRLMGQDEDLVIVGGGNSSVKVIEPDPITQKPGVVVHVKGSGSDMHAMKPAGFAPVNRQRIMPLRNLERLTDTAMIDIGRLALQDPNAPNPSVEYLLHVFVPGRFVLHSHADAINALTDQASEVNVNAILLQAFGPGIASIPYIMPGFPLAKAVDSIVRRSKHLDHLVLNKHGLFTFGPTAKAAYNKHIEMVSQAEDFAKSKLNGRTVFAVGNYAPSTTEEVVRAILGIRGSLGASPRFVVRHDGSPEAMRFANSGEAEGLSRIGLATPDHVLRTKGEALYTHPEQAARRDGLEAAIDKFRQEYVAYFERHKKGGLRMLDPNPRVIIVPGMGAFYAGKTAKDSADVMQIWHHTMRTIEAAEAVGKFDSISEAERHQFEYWELEQRKFGRTELPLTGKVALVTGAYGGIGSAIARKLAKEGAAVVLLDINPDVGKLEQEINKDGSGNAYSVATDITDEKAVESAFNEAALKYGGIDLFVASAGVIGNVAELRELDMAKLRRAADINFFGPALTLKYALRMMMAQGLGGHAVNISTKNVDSPGVDFGIYSSTKAAIHQMFRVAAKEAAPSKIRVNQVAPDGIFENSNLWPQDVREARARRYNIPVEKLAEFYQHRNMLDVKMTGDDVAQAVYNLELSPKTTGAVVRVDGGLAELI